MLKYLVVYASETGNTQMIANEIYDAIKSRSKEMINIRQWNGTHEAENYLSVSGQTEAVVHWKSLICYPLSSP